MSQRRVEVVDITVSEGLNGPVVEDLRAVSKGWLSAHWVNYQLSGEDANRRALVFATLQRRDGQGEMSPWQALSEDERATLIGAPLVQEALQSAEAVQYDHELTRDDANRLIEQFEDAA